MNAGQMNVSRRRWLRLHGSGKMQRLHDGDGPF